MEKCIVQAFQCNYKEILIDEIALSGLEGIEVEQLWKNFERHISCPITDKMKSRFWSFLVNRADLTFYQLPEPLEPVDIVDRFTIVDEETGHLADPPMYVDGPYEFCPVENEYGSCKYYSTRTQVLADGLRNMSYQEIMTTFGHTLVITASLELRWNALAPHAPFSVLQNLNTVQYCMLELIGKGRHNGQMTLGNSNLTNIVKDPKLLFYYRSHLQKYDLLISQYVTQIICQKGVKTLLVRLKRFYQPRMLNLPKQGLVYNLKEYLLKQPDHLDRTESITRQGIVTGPRFKKLRKTSNCFRFTERDLTSRKRKEKCVMLDPDSEESPLSEDESSAPVKCQFKVGMNLCRQAYERFLDAGLNGLTQVELGHLLGVEFYTTRAICRMFKSHNIVREFLEDRGKQRTAKYIAIHATKDMDFKFESEMKKFQEYLNESRNLDLSAVTTATETDTEVPKKKIKLEKATEMQGDHLTLLDDIDDKTLENNVIEVKRITGFQRSNMAPLLGSKKTTLRQLKFVNGALKALKENVIIQGYQKLSILASREAGEPPMDTKGTKVILQKLITEGQVKVYNMNWPNMSVQQCLLICAPHVKPTDPLIKAKYKETKMKVIAKTAKLETETLTSDSVIKLLTLHIYPRYMRIQKVHQTLYKMGYEGENDTNQFGLPKGFCSMVHVIPELTVASAISNLSPHAIREFAKFKITADVMEQKIKNVPDLFRKFLASSSFQNSFRFNLKVLAMLGLIQLIRNPNQTTEDTVLINNMFFVNQHATIIDTSGTWPRQDVDEEKLTKKYFFDNYSVVEAYWRDVYDISLKTTVLRDAVRERKYINPPLRAREKVLEKDDGKVLGNGLGPCGFDDTFFMEKSMLWNTYYTKLKASSNRPKKVVFKKEIKKVAAKKARKKIVKSSKPKTHIVTKSIPAGTKRTRLRLDTVVRWNAIEDRILMMCKAALTIMSPTSQPGCLRLRNLVAKEILQSADPKKTAANCHKRFLALQSNSSLWHEKDCIINELRHRRHLIQKYDGLYRVLRLRYHSITKILLEARLPALELVNLISRLTKSKSFKSKIPCVALNVEEFHSNYTVSETTGHKPYNFYKTPPSEPEMTALKEGIIMSVMMCFKHEQSLLYAQKMVSMFSGFSELSLRTGVDQLRKCGSLAAKEKLVNNQLQRNHWQHVLQDSFRISAVYQRRWICRLNAEFVDNLMDRVYMDVPKRGLKGSPELNCLLCELQACNVLELFSEGAPTISGPSGAQLTEEQFAASFLHVKLLVLNTGTSGWINKANIVRFSDLYQDMKVEESLVQLKSNMKVLLAEKTSLYPEDTIVSYLHTKQKLGATFPELEKHTNYDKIALKKKIQDLETAGVIKMMGYFENIIVLTEFAASWAMKIGDEYIIPFPYMDLNKEIRKEILLKWAGVVMNKVFEKPGISISYLTDHCELISSKALQDICMLLEKCKCITLNVMRSSEPDLFSIDDKPCEIEEFNEYESIENIIAFPVRDSLTRFAALKQKIIDSPYQ